MNLWICALAVLPLALAIPQAPGQYFDVLKNGRKEWRLAFRGTANVGKSVYEAFTKKMPGNVEPGCKGLNFNAKCTAHYRNDDALDNWWNVKDVMFGIVKDGVIVRTIMFNGKGTNSVNWFSKRHVRQDDNCWHDFDKKNLWIFSIAGHAAIERRFFIQHKYGGCPNDEGWFVAIDGRKRPCQWEKDNENFPVFKYSPGATRTNWQKGPVEKADAIVIFLRYTAFAGRPQEYHDVFKTGKRDWRLAFRGTAGAGPTMLQAYLTGQGVPHKVEPGCVSPDYSKPCRTHFRNKQIFDTWKGVKQVLFGIIKNGALVKTITFNGANTNLYTWFAANRVLDSCWHDLASSAKNFFRPQGHVGRHFFINHKYGGCPNDVGWLTVIDTGMKGPCAWSKSHRIPRILYAAGPFKANYNHKDGSMAEADAIVIYVKY